MAERTAAGRDDEVPVFVWTALGLTCALGMAAALLLAAVTPWMVTGVLSIPQELQQETRLALYVLAASLPLVTTSAALKGVLEGRHHFGISNAIQVGTGMVTFLGPLAVLPISTSIAAIMVVLVAGRLMAWLAYFVTSIRLLPAAHRHFAFERRSAAVLLRVGGWMAVSSIIGPIMVYMDRFLSLIHI